jgi:hypothetical protein
MQCAEDTSAWQVHFDAIMSDSSSVAANEGWHQVDSELIMCDINKYGIALDRPMELGDCRCSVPKALAHGRYISTLLCQTQEALQHTLDGIMSTLH